MAKILTAYFSASGVTAKIAEKLANSTGSDLYEIKPSVPYNKKDLDWTDKNSRSSKEMNAPDSRPEISGKAVDMDLYDVLFLGFPIWWYVAPTIIRTFLEEYDMSDKKIILFATSGGSGFGKTAEVLKGSVSETAEIIEGRVFNGRVSESDLKKWAEDIMKY